MTWPIVLRMLTGKPMPSLPTIPGRVIRAADAPLADEDLVDITSAAELASVLHITRAAAQKRLTARAAAQHTTTDERKL